MRCSGMETQKMWCNEEDIQKQTLSFSQLRSSVSMPAKPRTIAIVSPEMKNVSMKMENCLGNSKKFVHLG